MEKLEKCTNAQLRNYFKKLNLPTSSTKAELLTRLFATDLNSWFSANEQNAENSFGEDNEASSEPVGEGGIGSVSEHRIETSASASASVSAPVPVPVHIPEMVRRELDLLRREKEVLEAELRLARLNVGTSEDMRARAGPSGSVSDTRPRPFSRIKEIGELLPDFKGETDSFETWRSQVEFIRIKYGLDEDLMKILLSMKLKGRAQTWFQSSVTHLELSFTELLIKMDGMYNQRISRLQLRRNFEERTWRTNETFADYLHDKVTLGNKIPISEVELVEYAIDGIPDVRLRSQANMHRFRTREELLRAFATQSLDGGKKATLAPYRRDDKMDAARRTKSEAGPLSRGAARCYNCGEFGHLSPACQRPASREKGSCFRCGSKEHRVSACPKNQTKEPVKDSAKDHRPSSSSLNVVHSTPGVEPYTVPLKYTIVLFLLLQ